jgi:hypothetical protein
VLLRPDDNGWKLANISASNAAAIAAATTTTTTTTTNYNNNSQTINSKLAILIRDDEKVKCILIHVAISGGRNGIRKEAEKYTNRINIKT